ncbi:MAG: DNA repair protein RadC [Bacteroidota bacterium]
MKEYQSNLTIKSWAEEDRPREKLLLKGKSALSDVELIAILIRMGSKNESAVDVAKKIFKSVDNNLGELSKLSVRELINQFKGIGEAKAISIVAALELGRRRREEEGLKRETITSSADIFEIMQPKIADEKHEEFWVLLLNKANKILVKQDISKGGVSGTVADPKIIFKLALENLASSIILCHNHPSGNLKPSEQDIQLTKKLKKSGEVMDIPVIDHIIITDSGYYSFADEGIL